MSFIDQILSSRQPCDHVFLTIHGMNEKMELINRPPWQFSAFHQTVFRTVSPSTNFATVVVGLESPKESRNCGECVVKITCVRSAASTAYSATIGSIEGCKPVSGSSMAINAGDQEIFFKDLNPLILKFNTFIMLLSSLLYV
jgi:hypothetical protein